MRTTTTLSWYYFYNEMLILAEREEVSECVNVYFTYKANQGNSGMGEDNLLSLCCVNFLLNLKIIYSLKKLRC